MGLLKVYKRLKSKKRTSRHQLNSAQERIIIPKPTETLDKTSKQLASSKRISKPYHEELSY